MKESIKTMKSSNELNTEEGKKNKKTKENRIIKKKKI